MSRAVLVRLSIMLGAAILALMVMSRISDPTTSQITGVVIALLGVIISRLVYARMMRD